MCTYKDLQSQGAVNTQIYTKTRDRRRAQNQDGDYTAGTASVLSSVLLQILLYFSAFYSLFYFLSSLCIIIYKRMRSNLQESERYVGASLFITGATLLLSVYFLLWQSYVMRADVIVNAILLCIYGLSGVASFGALARFTRFGFRGFDRMTRGLS
ncbi:transmembrane protein 80-like isoform X5 [Silurus meridionalis]|uniref:transmembrane protein 80-like isoform X5 n=1 Tax=Silurus meridionalis TaxID=175797 RepID=UPI001EEC6803|nr:transmembrane protein 80-like isoform X5 [Silurus meridionalis]